MPTSSTPKVEFVQYHQPAVESGLYDLHVEQTISSTGGQVPSSTYQRDITFAVTGERFEALTPGDVHAVFPPPGSNGDHDNVLPHITLIRSTLPWERSPDGASLTLPWLVLLVLHDSDFASPSARPRLQTLSLHDLQNTSGYTAKFPAITLEPGQDPDDRVRVIDVERSLLENVLPGKSELAFLAHVRQAKDAQDQPTGPEMATVLANRLPQQNGSSTAYLVSVEDRYQEHGDGFDFQGAGSSDPIRLVCLNSWRFACADPRQSFSNLLLDLDRDTLRLPDTSSSTANTQLAMGRVPLPHLLREGDHTVSWYHGPLAPGRPGDTLELPVRCADELLRFDTASGLFDTAYAAAWELGRQLMLSSKKTSLDLYHWKRATAQQLKQDETEVTHLPLSRPASDPEIPTSVVDFFRKTSLLEGLPFSYLVPDERLLPVESIRFFRVDPRWVEALLDGAFSIGRVGTGALQQDADNPVATPYGNLSGFLLRSTLVSGWPGLLIEGYSERINNDDFVPSADTPLGILRCERLSSNVLLCLFDGEVATVDLHLKPETMHFGVDAPTGNPATFHKTLRNPTTGNDEPKALAIPWKSNSQVIDIAQLTSAMKSRLGLSTFTSAQFALEMISGAQKVRFTT